MSYLLRSASTEEKITWGKHQSVNMSTNNKVDHDRLKLHY